MKQNRAKSNMIKRVKLRLIKFINFSMIAIFLLISILQPLSASSNANSFKGTFFAEKTLSKNYTYQNDLLIEEENSEDDEWKQDHSVLNTLKYKLFSFQEIRYTATIKTRYLNLVSSILHTTETPLIVLHHTWKSDLV